MARKHGARRVAGVIRRYAKSHGIKRGMVPASVIGASVPTMPRYVPKVAPGTKIKVKYGEPVELSLQRLRRVGKTGGRIGKGNVVFTSGKRRNERRRKGSRLYKPYNENLGE